MQVTLFRSIYVFGTDAIYIGDDLFAVLEELPLIPFSAFLHLSEKLGADVKVYQSKAKTTKYYNKSLEKQMKRTKKEDIKCDYD